MIQNPLTRREFLGTTTALAMASAAPKAAAVGGNPNLLALHGGTPVRTRPFPSWPQTNELDEANILKAVRNHHWCTFDGEFIPKFEQAWAKHLGAGGCVMTPCGTHALHMALEVLGVEPGDEVLVAPFSFIADVDAIMLCRALPVFVDTDLATFQMDPADIERRITENTKAITPCHILGAPADMDRINAIAQRHNLPVVEDACQAHVTTWKGKPAGTLGTIGCFSFQESKVLPGGEAGALVSDHPELITAAYTFRNFGTPPHQSDTFAIRGTKYRISDFAAAILMAQIARYETLCKVREQNAAYLKERLSQIPGIMPQEYYPGSTRMTHYNFGLRWDKAQLAGLTQQQMIKAIKAEGIPSVESSTPPLNREPYLEKTLNSRGYQRLFSKQRLERYRQENVLPKNDELCATHVVMFHDVLMGTKADVDDVVEAFAKVQRNAAALAS